MLWAITGGSASNEILEYLDFDLIRKFNKTVIGYSDVTILLNALYTQTGKINLLGPNLKTLLK
jgi:muramoyltetrapeptide carboxypeptidase